VSAGARCTLVITNPTSAAGPPEDLLDPATDPLKGLGDDIPSALRVSKLFIWLVSIELLLGGRVAGNVPPQGFKSSFAAPRDGFAAFEGVGTCWRPRGAPGVGKRSDSGKFRHNPQTGKPVGQNRNPGCRATSACQHRERRQGPDRPGDVSWRDDLS